MSTILPCPDNYLIVSVYIYYDTGEPLPNAMSLSPWRLFKEIGGCIELFLRLWLFILLNDPISVPGYDIYDDNPCYNEENLLAT